LQGICKRVGPSEGQEATFRCHRGAMVRYLLLRFLPRKLVPLLFLLEIFRLVRHWQRRNDPVVVDRSRRLQTGTDMDGTPLYLADRGI
jgi:hypothetical protein